VNKIKVHKDLWDKYGERGISFDRMREVMESINPSTAEVRDNFGKFSSSKQAIMISNLEGEIKELEVGGETHYGKYYGTKHSYSKKNIILGKKRRLHGWKKLG